MKTASKNKYIFLALIIIIGLIFLNFVGASSKIKNYFYFVYSPAQEFFDGSFKKIKNGFNFLGSLKKIYQKNIILEEEINKLLSENIGLKELTRENDFLRSRLNLPSDVKYQIELADVVGKDFQGLEKYILINKGRTGGIKENMAAIVSENILIGRVAEVFDNFSKIILISGKNIKTPALIQESRAEGIIRGEQGQILFMDLIPKEIKVEQGQTVITSGIDGVFPRGLLIGRVVEVEFQENEIFQKVKVKPIIDTEKIEMIFIIKQ